VVPSQLIKLGQQALADVTTNVAKGEPLVRCQLLASEFYKALKRELRTTSELSAVERGMVVAAANLCCHAATANIGPDAMLGELKRSIDLLRVDIASCDPSHVQPRSRPKLRVIEGGLSKVG
jgi:hypothetical protein